MARLLIAVLLALLDTLALPGAAPAQESWRWPVHGPVVHGFSVALDPFVRGQHRGIDIAARRGAAVRSACAGRVRFAGTVGRSGRTVSARCGPYVVTYLHLARITTGPGHVVAGERIGVVGEPLHLGVRRAADRFGYVDPLSLLPTTGPGPSPPSLPVVHVRPPTARPVKAPPPPASVVPTAAWLGLALLGLAVPGLAVVGTRGRRRQSSAKKRFASSASASQSS